MQIHIKLQLMIVMYITPSPYANLKAIYKNIDSVYYNSGRPLLTKNPMINMAHIMKNIRTLGIIENIA